MNSAPRLPPEQDADRVELSWRRLAIVTLNAVTFGVLIGLIAFPIGTLPHDQAGSPASHQGTALIGGPFRLTSHNGMPLSDEDIRGRPALIAFGYVSNPDLTTATLQNLSAVSRNLGADANRIAILFVGLDTGPDAAPKLKTFMENFDNRLIAASGTPTEIAAIAHAYRLPIGDHVDSATRSEIANSFEPLIFLMNPQGQYVTHLTHEISANAIMVLLRRLL